MRTETRTRTLYKFDELSPEAQQHALEQQSQIESEYFDSECIIDDAATIADLFGLDIRQTRETRMNGEHYYAPTIYYSGFCSQGDGACFEGTYSYKAGALKAVKYHADAEETVKECLRDFADWIYKQLENEYDYRTGEEAIEANDYEFTEKGDMA